MSRAEGRKPKVTIQCPTCEEHLKFYTFDQEPGSVRWSLTHSSAAHLQACPNGRVELASVTELRLVPEETPLLGIA